MDDKVATLRGQLEGLFSDLTASIQAEQTSSTLPKAGPDHTPHVDGSLEQALGESEARFREWFDEAPVGYHEIDSEGRITRVNRTELEMLGYTAEEMLGRPVWEFVQNQDVSRQTTLTQLAGQLPLEGVEQAYIRKDGSLLAVLIQDRYVRGTDGKIKGIRTAIQDISARQQAEEALANTRNLLHTLIDNWPGRMYVKDIQGRFIVGNMELVRHIGATTLDEVVGKTDFDFYPRELAEQYYADEQAILQSGQPLVTHKEPGVDAAGNRGWTWTTRVPLRDSQGQIVGIVGMASDITEPKAVEEALIPQKQPVQPVPISSPVKPKLKRTGLAARLIAPALIGLVGVAGLWVVIVSGRFFVSPFPTIASRGQMLTPVPPTSISVLPTATLDPETQMARWGTVDIRELVRDPDQYNGDELHYDGEVFDIQETNEGTLVRIWIQVANGNSYDRVAVTVLCRCLVSKAYQGRHVQFWGYGGGTIEETNAPGGSVQRPLIWVTSAEYIQYD